MAWDTSSHGGFSSSDPWLPLHADWQDRNVASQSRDPCSMLILYRQLLALRRKHPALAIGSYHAVAAEGDVLAFERRHGDERLLIVLNLGGESGQMPPETGGGRELLSTLEAPSTASEGYMLRPNEGLVLALSA